MKVILFVPLLAAAGAVWIFLCAKTRNLLSKTPVMATPIVGTGVVFVGLLVAAAFAVFPGQGEWALFVTTWMLLIGVHLYFSISGLLRVHGRDWIDVLRPRRDPPTSGG